MLINKNRLPIGFLLAFVILVSLLNCSSGMAFDQPNVELSSADESEESFVTINSSVNKSSESSLDNNGVKAAQTYIVQSGDSLWKIARNILGSGSRWGELVEANKDKFPSLEKNPNLIYPGWELDIPGINIGEDSASKQEPVVADSSEKKGSTGQTSQISSSIGAAVSAEAKKLVSKYPGYQSFPYDPLTDGGNLGCAQVVTTALKAAGVLSKIQLNCDNTVADLKAAGWQKVNVPPYADGDVLTWTTSRGPGRHIGIIVKNGNSFQAMSNSSSRRCPRFHDINYMPITQVLRKI